jgi:uncharacterized protein (DUF2384 family)
MLAAVTAHVDDERINAAFKAVATIADALGLTWQERCALLDIPRSTYHRWLLHGVKADQDKQDRIAYLLGIYHLAGTAFPGAGGAKGWLTRPNPHPAFKGSRPLDRMLAGRMEDLIEVFQILRGVEAIWS